MNDKKLITITDIGRNLTPIGYTFKSPVLKPSLFNLEAIGRFIFECRCTSIFEHYPEDVTFKVALTADNYTKTFDELWEEQNPGVVFPYTNTVDTIVDTEPDKSEKVDTDEEPKAGEPEVTEEPKASEPEVVEEPKAGEPEVTEEPTQTGEPEVVEEPKVGEPEVTEEPKAGEPEVTEEPKAGEPEVTEEPAASADAKPPVARQQPIRRNQR